MAVLPPVVVPYAAFLERRQSRCLIAPQLGVHDARAPGDSAAAAVVAAKALPPEQKDRRGGRDGVCRVLQISNWTPLVKNVDEATPSHHAVPGEGPAAEDAEVQP